MSSEPQLFRINPENRQSDRIQEVDFARLGLRERQDIQEWVAANPGILGDDLLIIGKEFSGFDRTNERLDLLAVDSNGRLVIVELKRDDTGADAHWQAIKYASYLHTCPLPACRHDAPLPRPPVPAPKAERSDRNARVRRRVEELLEAGAQKSVAVGRWRPRMGRQSGPPGGGWKRPVASLASALAGSADLDSGRRSPEHEGGAVEVERFWAGFREPPAPAPATSVMVPGVHGGNPRLFRIPMGVLLVLRRVRVKRNMAPCFA